MERISELKFQKLSAEEMNQVQGGKERLREVIVGGEQWSDGADANGNYAAGYSYYNTKEQSAKFFLGIRVSKWEDTGNTGQTGCTDNCSQS